jgi:hypothetical protein
MAAFCCPEIGMTFLVRVYGAREIWNRMNVVELQDEDDELWQALWVLLPTGPIPNRA